MLDIYVRNVRRLLDSVRVYRLRCIECERDGSSRDYPILPGYGPRSIHIQLHSTSFNLTLTLFGLINSIRFLPNPNPNITPHTLE